MSIDDLRDEVINGPKKNRQERDATADAFRETLDPSIESMRPDEPYRFVLRSPCCNARLYSAAFMDGKQLDYNKLPEIWSSLPLKRQRDIIINKYCSKCGKFIVRVA